MRRRLEVYLDKRGVGPCSSVSGNDNPIAEAVPPSRAFGPCSFLD